MAVLEDTIGVINAGKKFEPASSGPLSRACRIVASRHGAAGYKLMRKGARLHQELNGPKLWTSAGIAGSIIRFLKHYADVRIMPTFVGNPALRVGTAAKGSA